MTRILIQAAAQVDIDLAASWYESNQGGLGIEFLLELDAAMERIVDFPRSYEIQYLSARRALMRRFPYAIYYVLMGSTLEVFAVLHQHENPDNWQDRV